MRTIFLMSLMLIQAKKSVVFVQKVKVLENTLT